MKKFCFIVLALANTSFGMTSKNNNGSSQSVPTSPIPQRITQPTRPQTPTLRESSIRESSMSPEMLPIMNEILRAMFGGGSSDSTTPIGSEASTSDGDKDTEPVTGTLTWCDNTEVTVTIKDKDGTILLNKVPLANGNRISWDIYYFGEVLLTIKRQDPLLTDDRPYQKKLYPVDYCAFFTKEGTIEFTEDCENC